MFEGYLVVCIGSLVLEEILALGPWISELFRKPCRCAEFRQFRASVIWQMNEEFLNATCLSCIEIFW